jgi:hypothetical protein
MTLKNEYKMIQIGQKSQNNENECLKIIEIIVTIITDNTS